MVVPSLPKLGYMSSYTEVGGSGRHGVVSHCFWKLLNLTLFLNPEVAFN